MIEWKCDRCGRSDGEHINIFINFEDLNHPMGADWLVLHIDCDPDVEGNCYSVDARNMRDQSQILAWTVHFAGKGWLRRTNWIDFLRERDLIPELL